MLSIAPLAVSGTSISEPTHCLGGFENAREQSSQQQSGSELPHPKSLCWAVGLVFGAAIIC